jgi:hypothetical protein
LCLLSLALFTSIIPTKIASNSNQVEITTLSHEAVKGSSYKVVEISSNQDSKYAKPEAKNSRLEVFKIEKTFHKRPLHLHLPPQYILIPFLSATQHFQSSSYFIPQLDTSTSRRFASATKNQFSAHVIKISHK